MRIVVDARGLLFPHKTGIQLFTEELLLRLVEDPHDEYVLALDREPDGQVPGPLLDKAVPLVVGAPPEPRQLLWEQHYLPRAVERAGADLLYGPQQLLPLSGRFGRVNTIYDASVYQHADCFTEADGRYYRRWIRASAFRADRITTISEGSRQGICEALGLDPARIRVIYPAVDHDAYRPSVPDAEVARVRDAHGIEGPYVLYLGALEPRKNVPRLVRGFVAAVREHGFDHTLVIAGAKAWLFEEIERAVADAETGDRIVMTGYVAQEDKPGLYAGADAFVYPSLYEGFGMPPAEAMACGTATVVSDRPAMPEMAGGAALLVDPESVPSIAEGISRVLGDADLRSDLARKGAERARFFDWSRSALELREVFAEAVP